MKLIGMLDSPYVRRVAICLKLLKLDFEHRPISVFSGFEEFRKLNPVVKAPTLILDDGQSLMDSTLILDYVTATSGSAVTSTPECTEDRLRATRLTGLALAACEKTVQIVYERNLRPVENSTSRGSIASVFSCWRHMRSSKPKWHWLPCPGRGPAWTGGRNGRGRLEIHPDDGAEDCCCGGVSQAAIVLGFRRAAACFRKHAA